MLTSVLTRSASVDGADNFTFICPYIFHFYMPVYLSQIRVLWSLDVHSWHIYDLKLSEAHISMYFRAGDTQEAGLSPS